MARARASKLGRKVQPQPDLCPRGAAAILGLLAAGVAARENAAQQQGGYQRDADDGKTLVAAERGCRSGFDVVWASIERSDGDRAGRRDGRRGGRIRGLGRW